MSNKESYEIEGNKLTVMQDEIAENPRVWDNLGTIVYAHRGYDLGEIEMQGGFSSIYQEFKEIVVYQEIGLDCSDEYAEGVMGDQVVYLPVYLLDHSGLRVNTTGFASTWDSGQVGYIFATYDEIKEWFIIDEVTFEDIKTVKKMLKEEVGRFDKYLAGDVWGFSYQESKTCPCCDHTKWEDIESCWGYYGFEELKRGLIDHLGEEIANKFIEKL